MLASLETSTSGEAAGRRPWRGLSAGSPKHLSLCLRLFLSLRGEPEGEMEVKEGKVGSGGHQRLTSSIWGLRSSGTGRGLGRVSALRVPCADGPSRGQWRGGCGQVQEGQAGRPREGMPLAQPLKGPGLRVSWHLHLSDVPLRGHWQVGGNGGDRGLARMAVAM